VSLQSNLFQISQISNKMIEVLAKLKGGPSFFAGEKIICSVLFQSSEGEDKSNSNYPNSRLVGWLIYHKIF
jgi:hypothetical protein